MVPQKTSVQPRSAAMVPVQSGTESAAAKSNNQRQPSAINVRDNQRAARCRASSPARNGAPATKASALAATLCSRSHAPKPGVNGRFRQP